MAVAFGQLRRPMTLSVIGTSEAQGLATGLGRQLGKEGEIGPF